MEEWRDVAGYEGCYEVSNLGRVRSVDRSFVTKTGKVVPIAGVEKHPHVNPNGYMEVNLHRGSKHKLARVHRLVAEAFIPNPECKPEVNHIDGNKLNNSAVNLEYCTNDENNEHAMRAGLNRRIPVLMDGVHRFESITKCARHLGVDKHEIRRALDGTYKSVHGHTFEIDNGNPA